MTRILALLTTLTLVLGACTSASIQLGPDGRPLPRV